MGEKIVVVTDSTADVPLEEQKDLDIVVVPAVVTLDGESNNFGRLLRFKPTVGGWRTWAMPMDLLAGDGREMRAELLSMGLEIDPKARS